MYEENRYTTVDLKFVEKKFKILKESEDISEKIDSGCLIWDLSSNKNFSKFLIQLGVVEMIKFELKDKKLSYRMKEIYFGILSNFFLTKEFELEPILVFENLQLENVELLSEMIKFLSLLVISSKKSIWIPEILKKLEIFLMILQNSLIEELIKNTIILLKNSSYYDKNIALSLSNEHLNHLIDVFTNSIEE